MPRPVERLDAVVRGELRFDVHDSGPLDGEPVVLLHGFPQRASSWQRVTPLLHDVGLRTLAVEQRGYSPGARPRFRTAYSTEGLVADLAAVVDAVGRPVHVVGHDWGAVVGWAAAVLRPELLRTLTAVSVPHPGAMAAACLRSDQLLRSWYVAAFQVPWLPERVLASGLGTRALRASGMDPDTLSRFQDEVVGDGALPGALGWYRAMPFSDPRIARRRVEIPTTFVWSDGDTAVSRVAAHGAGDFVDAAYTYVELQGVSHWVPEQAPEQLAAAIIDRIGSDGQ
ncbi:MAG: alpha/beta fold hydrolase [Nocardioides sp.]